MQDNLQSNIYILISNRKTLQPTEPQDCRTHELDKWLLQSNLYIDTDNA